MKTTITCLLLLIGISVFSQTHHQEIEGFQKELNTEFSNPAESPLTDQGLTEFKELNFFTIDEKYRVEAKFVRTEDAVPFKMKTTTSRLPTYVKYGEAIFEIDGVEYKLSIYQSVRLSQTLEHENYLFLPFTDLTNGEESYIGGRFIDLSIPNGNTMVIDFNKAYNPYCAYNHKYSCPIPPDENHLEVKIKAGVKAYAGSH